MIGRRAWPVRQEDRDAARAWRPRGPAGTMAQCRRPWRGRMCAGPHFETRGNTASNVRERTDARVKPADNRSVHPESAIMKTAFRSPLTLLPLIAGAAVLLFGTAGVAHIDGWPLGATNGRSASGATPTRDTRFDDPGASVGPMAATDAPARRRCVECGVIASIREVGAYEEPAIAGMSGNDARPLMAARSYRFTVRLENGAQHEILDANPSAWRIGERVNVIDGKRSAKH